MPQGLLATVFKTIFSRRDAKIFLTFSFLPLLVPFLSDNMEGMTADYAKSFLSFFETTLQTQYRLILPVLIFSMLISSVFRDEIDSGILFLYKDISRKKLFNAKIVGLLIIYAMNFVGTAIVSFITYYLILVPKWGIQVYFVPQNQLALEKVILLILVTIFLNVSTTVIVSMVAITHKTLVAALSGVFFALVSVTLPLLTGVKYLAPATYVYALEEGGGFVVLLMVLAISLTYCIPFYLKGKRSFEKVEY